MGQIERLLLKSVKKPDIPSEFPEMEILPDFPFLEIGKIRSDYFQEFRSFQFWKLETGLGKPELQNMVPLGAFIDGYANVRTLASPLILTHSLVRLASKTKSLVFQCSVQ